jgi:hypothetical protein
MTFRLALCTLVFLPVLACAEANAPADLRVVATSQTVSAAADAPLIPSWAANPEVFPAELQGTNNCTFPPPLNVQWNFHPEGGCWERAAPDGWTRQQQHRIHVFSLTECNGGPGDVSPIRICRAPDLPNPCPINATTGPNGCALCVRSISCH